MKKLKPIILKKSKRNGLAVAAQRRSVYIQQNKQKLAPEVDDEWYWGDEEEAR